MILAVAGMRMVLVTGAAGDIRSNLTECPLHERYDDPTPATSGTPGQRTREARDSLGYEPILGSGLIERTIEHYRKA